MPLLSNFPFRIPPSPLYFHHPFISITPSFPSRPFLHPPPPYSLYSLQLFLLLSFLISIAFPYLHPAPLPFSSSSSLSCKTFFSMPSLSYFLFCSLNSCPHPLLLIQILSHPLLFFHCPSPYFFFALFHLIGAPPPPNRHLLFLVKFHFFVLSSIASPLSFI